VDGTALQGHPFVSAEARQDALVLEQSNHALANLAPKAWLCRPDAGTRLMQ
jgi:hypothetical protein